MVNVYAPQSNCRKSIKQFLWKKLFTSKRGTSRPMCTILVSGMMCNGCASSTLLAKPRQEDQERGRTLARSIIQTGGTSSALPTPYILHANDIGIIRSMAYAMHTRTRAPHINKSTHMCRSSFHPSIAHPSHTHTHAHTFNLPRRNSSA